MLTEIRLARESNNPKDPEILDVLELLSETYGSGVNALRIVVERSPMYQSAQRRMAERAAGKK